MPDPSTTSFSLTASYLHHIVFSLTAIALRLTTCHAPNLTEVEKLIELLEEKDSSLHDGHQV